MKMKTTFGVEAKFSLFCITVFCYLLTSVAVPSQLNCVNECGKQLTIAPVCQSKHHFWISIITPGNEFHCHKHQRFWLSMLVCLRKTKQSWFVLASCAWPENEAFQMLLLSARELPLKWKKTNHSKVTDTISTFFVPLHKMLTLFWSFTGHQLASYKVKEFLTRMSFRPRTCDRTTATSEWPELNPLASQKSESSWGFLRWNFLSSEFLHCLFRMGEK